MKKYTTPDLSVLELDVQDVIQLSNGGQGGTTSEGTMSGTIVGGNEGGPEDLIS